MFRQLLLLHYCLGIAWDIKRLHGQRYSHAVYVCAFAHARNFTLLSVCGIFGLLRFVA